jgi:hypothetical protein
MSPGHHTSLTGEPRKRLSGDIPGRVYVAGPLFSDAERAWLDDVSSRLRAAGVECFVPHEHFPDLTDVTTEGVYRVDADGLRSCNALLAWLDGPMVDDGTACEIGMFAELARREPERYRGIVGIVTDLRLERRRERGVVGGGANLFVVGAIESCGTIVHTVDDAITVLTGQDG